MSEETIRENFYKTVFLIVSFSQRAQEYNRHFVRRRRLPDEVKTCRNYAYLQEIYDAVRATDSEYFYFIILF